MDWVVLEFACLRLAPRSSTNRRGRVPLKSLLASFENTRTLSSGPDTGHAPASAVRAHDPHSLERSALTASPLEM